MNSEEEKPEWDLLHRSLRALPDREAPRSLGDRVKRAIQERSQLAWWQRPLLEWPKTMRLGGLAFGTVMLIGAVWFGAAALSGLAETATQWVGSSLNPILSVAGQVGSVLSKAVVLLLGKVSAGMWVGLGLVATLVYASGIGIGTLFWKVANDRG